MKLESSSDVDEVISCDDESVDTPVVQSPEKNTHKTALRQLNDPDFDIEQNIDEGRCDISYVILNFDIILGVRLLATRIHFQDFFLKQ